MATKITLEVPDELHSKIVAWAANQYRSMHSALLVLLQETMSKGEPSAAERQAGKDQARKR